MMKISNKVDEIKIEDVSAYIAVSCIYMMKNLYNGKVYIGKGYNATYNYPSVERAHEIVEDNAEHIIRCLKNNGIRFRLEIKL